MTLQASALPPDPNISAYLVPAPQPGASSCAAQPVTPISPPTTGHTTTAPTPTVPLNPRGNGPNDAGTPINGPRGAGPNDADTPNTGPRGAGPKYAGTADTSLRRAGLNEADTGLRGSGADQVAAVPVPRATDDAEERRRKALEANQTPIPRRGNVPPEAIPGAEACIRVLSLEFSLRAAGTGATPTDEIIRATLTKVGLSAPVVAAGPAFAASTGKACIVGTFTDTKPSMAIAPLSEGGACTP